MTCKCCHCKEKIGCVAWGFITLLTWFVVFTSGRFWATQYKLTKQPEVPTVIEAPR